MLYLLSEMSVCLIAVAVLSFAFGWILRRKLAKMEINRLEKVWKINLLAKDLAQEQSTPIKKEQRKK